MLRTLALTALLLAAPAGAQPVSPSPDAATLAAARASFEPIGRLAMIRSNADRNLAESTTKKTK